MAFSASLDELTALTILVLVLILRVAVVYMKQQWLDRSLKMSKEWVMVRLTVETHRQLNVLGALWQTAAQEGMTHLPYNPDGERASLNDIVAELIRRDDEHRNRARNARNEKARKALQDMEQQDRPEGGEQPPSVS